MNWLQAAITVFCVTYTAFMVTVIHFRMGRKK
jgi:hypothetical protein